MPPFHRGELSVQERAGVRDRASRVGGSIHAEIPPAASTFLEERSWVVLATGDGSDRPWASLLAGEPGFARMAGPREVLLGARPAAGDPLTQSFREGGFAGLLAIDLATRRRMRVNGTLAPSKGGAALLRAEQVYSNCPRYIHPRADALGERIPAGGRSGTSLAAHHEAFIRQADTCFIATLNPGEGADASHRGGPPGFVKVAGSRLRWPDYAGNMMYNSLGNIAAYPWAGLLFVDFERGDRLMVTGRAAIDWDPAHAASVAGAERLVELEVEAVIELATL
jgi:predicted pyridoxine 5'-phosphate oxidase superfamily flavin-nucleotide-binding protein